MFDVAEPLERVAPGGQSAQLAVLLHATQAAVVCSIAKRRAGHDIVQPEALEALVAIAQLDQNGTHAEICTGVHVVPRQLLQGLRIERAGFCQRIKPQSAGGVPCACDLPQASALFPAGFEPGRRAPAVPMG